MGTGKGLNPRIRGPQISAELDGRSKLPFVVLATHGALREHGAINGRTYEIFGRGFNCGTAIRFCADHSTLAGNWRGTAVHQGGRAACDL
jgi:hypothetical protein